MATRVLPVAKSIILCDDVVPDPGTDKVHLIGVFDAIHPRSDQPFPHRHPAFAVFLQLTDGEGQALGQVRARRADSDQTVFSSPEHPIQYRDRLQLKSVCFRLRNCPFPVPGLYWIQFLYDGQLVAEQRLRLLR
jgi:hypothetical protein